MDVWSLYMQQVAYAQQMAAYQAMFPAYLPTMQYQFVPLPAAQEPTPIAAYVESPGLQATFAFVNIESFDMFSKPRNQFDICH